MGRAREKQAIIWGILELVTVGPRSPCEDVTDREARAMNDASQFATAMLALVFTGALLVTGQLFLEQCAQRDVVYATSHLLR